MKLSDFKVLTFDCYGTLIDWESGMIAALEPLTSQVPYALKRNEILEAHAYYESTQQADTPTMGYQQILATVYRRLSEYWRVPISNDDCLHYGNSVKDWPAFEDSAESLQYLKQHFKLVILSNVDQENFAASNAKLDVHFDAIFTAADIGTYKPDDNNFDYMLKHLERLGYKRSDILHVAESMFHDHAPANRQKLTSCRIWRRYQQKGFGATMDPGQMPTYHFRYTSMAEFVAAHQKEQSAK